MYPYLSTPPYFDKRFKLFYIIYPNGCVNYYFILLKITLNYTPKSLLIYLAV
jgi:hypothetical protein